MHRFAKFLAAAALAASVLAPTANASSLADALAGANNARSAEIVKPQAAPSPASPAAAANPSEGAQASDADGAKPWVCRYGYYGTRCRYVQPVYHYRPYYYRTHYYPSYSRSYYGYSHSNFHIRIRW